MPKYVSRGWLKIKPDYIPAKYGMLNTSGPAFTVRSDYPSPRGTGARLSIAWQVCQCDCGNYGVYLLSNLRKGNTRSCGCFRQESLVKTQFQHGKSKTGEYVSWSCMVRRCHDPKNTKYVRYGASGISVCARWREPNGQGFLNFEADMGPKPGPEYTIDRYPNREGNYEPGNCRWATKEEQANNCRNSRKFTYKGETKGLSQFARQYGVSPHRLRHHIRAGLTIVEAFNKLGVVIDD